MRRVFLACILCILAAGSSVNGAPPPKNTSTPSGAVVTPQKPEYVYGTRVDVLFTSSDTAFDTETYVGINQFVIPQSGIYLLTLRGFNLQDSSFVALYYSLNGGPFSETCFSIGTVGAYSLCNGSELLQLNAGDTIRFGAYSSSDNIGGLRFGISKQ
jgi:hypothetical protein